MFDDVKYFPLLGPKIPPQEWAKIDLEKPFLRMKTEELPVDYLYRILEEVKHISHQKVFWGGYLEKRIYYGQSRHFTNERQRRDIHLGIDIWAPVGTPIYAPTDLIVHSYKYNDQDLDYGGTIVGQLEDESCLLFGHLSLRSLDYIEDKQLILKGQVIGWLGDESENGGWPPHLHFQHILDMGNMLGDFPGVVSADQLKDFIGNCPNPQKFLSL